MDKQESSDDLQQSNNGNNVSFAALKDSMDKNTSEASRSTKEKFYAAMFFFASYLLTPAYIIAVLMAAFIIQGNMKPIERADNSTDDVGLCPSEFLYGTLDFQVKVALSTVPIVCVFGLILGYNMNSKYAAPITLALSILIALVFFQDGPGWGDYGKSGTLLSAGFIAVTIFDRIVWTVFDYAFNVFAAFYFLRIVQLWGVVDSMREDFEELADDPARKIVLVAFCFAIIVAVVAPGGSNFLIAGSILIDMNIMKLPPGDEKDKYDKRIGAICLFGNGLTSAFNLVGVCIIALADDIMNLVVDAGVSTPCEPFDNKCAEKQIGYHFSLQFFFLSVLSPVYMAYLYIGKFDLKFFKHDFPIIFFSGLVYAAVQFLSSYYIGPELPCLLAAGAASIAFVAWVQIERKINPNEAPHISYRESLEKRKYLIPFVLLSGLLLAVGLIPGFASFLSGGKDKNASAILNFNIINIRTACGNWVRKFPILAHSGMTVFFCAIATPILMPYRKTKDNVEIEEGMAAVASVNKKTGLRSGSIVDLNVKNLKKRMELVRQNSFRGIPDENIEHIIANINEGATTRALHFMDRSEWFGRYRIALRRAFIDAYHESIPVMISIASYASLAKVMSGFYVTQTLALGLVKAFEGNPAGFAFVSPFIGMIGSALTGSTTTSNYMFGQLQVITALELELVTPTKSSIWAVAGAQILGATAGEVISPMNAVFSTILLHGRFPDSDLIKLVLPIFIPWLLVCMVCGYISVAYIP